MEMEATRCDHSSIEPHQSNCVTTSGFCIPWELITNTGPQRLPASGPQFNNIPQGPVWLLQLEMEIVAVSLNMDQSNEITSERDDTFSMRSTTTPVYSTPATQISPCATLNLIHLHNFPLSCLSLWAYTTFYTTYLLRKQFTLYLLLEFKSIKSLPTYLVKTPSITDLSSSGAHKWCPFVS